MSNDEHTTRPWAWTNRVVVAPTSAWLKRISAYSPPRYDPESHVIEERERALILGIVAIFIWVGNVVPTKLNLFALETADINPSSFKNALAILLGLYFVYFLLKWYGAYHAERKQHNRYGPSSQ